MRASAQWKPHWPSRVLLWCCCFALPESRLSPCRSAVWTRPGRPPGWLPAVMGALVGLAWMWRLLQQRLQGFTGDGLGATQQLSELLFYLGLALAL